MKTYFLTYIACFTLGGAIILMLIFLWKPFYESLVSYNKNIQGIEKIPLPWEGICWNSEVTCPALKKINDRLSFANNITAISHTIEKDKDWKIIATINFPAFSEHTKEEKQEIIKKIHQSGAEAFSLGIASQRIDYQDEIKNIFSKLEFDDIRIQIYTEPENLITIFDVITWKASKNLQFTIEFINLQLPKDIKVFNYIYMSEKMIRSNNGNIPIASFSIVFNPLFDEFDDLFDRYILYPVEQKLFMNIPTSKLNIKGLHTTYTNRTDGIYENQKWKTYDFLKNNPIPDIYIDSIWKKENGDITLTGF